MALLTTNGMFIIDEIVTDKETYHDVLGGGGTYAMLGASICCPDDHLRQQLRWIVDRGVDFPEKVTKILESWGTGCSFRDDPNRPTTRGWNLYGENEFRDFKYLTPKKRIDVPDWVENFGTEQVKNMKCFHLLCSAERVGDILMKLKQYDFPQNDNRTFVWEPIPDLCNAEHIHEITKLLNMEEHRFIISPNAEEAARIFNEKEPLDLQGCIDLIRKFDYLMKSDNTCVLRCGKLGSLTLAPRTQHGTREVIHFPAYHQASPERVIDPTGGGNTFLGGYALGYAVTQDHRIAGILANVAAGCAIEQIGMPLRIENKFNGFDFETRLQHYLSTYQLPYSPSEIVSNLSIK